MLLMNAPTKTINTFLVNIVNRAPIPDSMKAAIGDDPLGKLKSVRSMVSDPKSVIDELPLPDSVKEMADSVLPNSANDIDKVKSKVTFAPESTADSVIVPVVAAAVVATVVAKTESTPKPAPAPAPAPAPPPTPKPAPTKPPGIADKPKPANTATPAQQKQNDDKNKKAKIELNAADLANVQAFLKQKGTEHKVIQ